MSRRTFLSRAGWLLAGAGLLPLQKVVASEAISPVMAKLSDYMAQARNRAVPDEVLETAKHHILATLAAMISGSQLPPRRAASEQGRAHSGTWPVLQADAGDARRPHRIACAATSAGGFRTQIFERYQRSEKALVAAIFGNVGTRRVHAQGEDHHRRLVRPASSIIRLPQTSRSPNRGLLSSMSNRDSLG